MARTEPSARADEGAVALEYAILLTLIAAVIVFAVAEMGLHTAGNFQGVLPAFLR